jgi:hypothetical protein
LFVQIQNAVVQSIAHPWVEGAERKGFGELFVPAQPIEKKRGFGLIDLTVGENPSA